MISLNIIYLLAALSFAILWLALWFASSLSIGRMIILLFILDVILTIGAGIDSNVILMAMLHVITIPAFFGLVYLDLIEQHKTEFICFVCGFPILQVEHSEKVRSIIKGRGKQVLVHTDCVRLDINERKLLRRPLFKRGIPA